MTEGISFSRDDGGDDVHQLDEYMLFQGVMLYGDAKQRLRALFAIADTSRDDVMTPEELRRSLVFATKITLRNDPAHQGTPVVLTDEQNKRVDDAVAAVFAAVDADKVCTHTPRAVTPFFVSQITPVHQHRTGRSS